MPNVRSPFRFDLTAKSDKSCAVKRGHTNSVCKHGATVTVETERKMERGGADGEILYDHLEIPANLTRWSVRRFRVNQQHMGRRRRTEHEPCSCAHKRSHAIFTFVLGDGFKTSTPTTQSSFTYLDRCWWLAVMLWRAAFSILYTQKSAHTRTLHKTCTLCD